MNPENLGEIFNDIRREARENAILEFLKDLYYLNSKIEPILASIWLMEYTPIKEKWEKELEK